MQNTLALKTGGRLALDKDVHHALEDFRWMQENISTRPTWITEVVPLPPVAVVSLPHNLLYSGTDGQISSPLGW